jgi:hypothetical protein
VIEPTPQPTPEPARAAPKDQPEPIVLEDLAAVVRLPSLYRKVRRVLDAALHSFRPPSDAPMQPVSSVPGDCVLEYGWSWMDGQGLLRIFLGMSWTEQGHDPIWEVRVEATDLGLAEQVRVTRWHQLAARRAGSRFSEWDRFWHEEDASSLLLIGASAACTRFLEDENPERAAAEYLGAALYAMWASGAIDGLLAAARGEGGKGEAGDESGGGEASGGTTDG